MTRHFNTIVLGLGGVGSAALYQLARRGDRVLGIDQFDPPHQMGSSHGETRITRQAIGEGLQYTPLVLRAYEIFRDLEKQSGERLLSVVGGLMISSPGSGGIHDVKDFYENCVNAARQFQIKHDLLDAGDIRRRFPQFRVRDDERAYFEYEAGILYPERCIDVQLKLAENNGAEICRNQKATALVQKGDKVKLSTAGGEYTADQLVLSAGPWLPSLIGEEVASQFQVVRQVLHWFDVSSCYDLFEPAKFPIFIWEIPGHPMYGFPAMAGAAGGFKIGAAAYNQSVAADTVDRQVSAEEVRIVYEEQIAPFFTPPVGACIKSNVCLYTVSPDSAFVIDRVPSMPSVLLCSPCSGHGFKHTASIGEAIAQLVLDGQSQLDLSMFKLERFAGLAQTSQTS